MNKKQFWNDLKSGEFVSMVKESSVGKFILFPGEVYNVMKPIFAKKDDIERVYCIFLNNKSKIISIEKMFDGTINTSAIYTREIIKQVLKFKATAIILVHNHPAGDPEPSIEDKQVTIKVGIALLSIDAELKDHVIIGDSYYSMSDEGYIKTINDRMKELHICIN